MNKRAKADENHVKGDNQSDTGCFGNVCKNMLVASIFCPLLMKINYTTCHDKRAFSVTFKGIKTAVKNKRKKQ